MQERISIKTTWLPQPDGADTLLPSLYLCRGELVVASFPIRQDPCIDVHIQRLRLIRPAFSAYIKLYLGICNGMGNNRMQTQRRL